MEYDKDQETLSSISREVFSVNENYGEITELYLQRISYLEEQIREGRQEECDPNTAYSLNSKFYRSPEFGKVDLLVAGCSQTFGMGVDEEAIWPRLLSEKLGYSYANIAVPGATVQSIVGSVVSYIKEYGAPKVIAINLPGYGRMSIPLKPLYNTQWNVKPEKLNRYSPDTIGLAHINFGYREMGEKEIPLISKRPHSIDEILPYEVALHQSMFSLSMLIEYCKALGVPLVFSTWHGAMNELMEKKISDPRTKIDLSGYCKIPIALWPERDLCHSELEDKYPEIWVEGRDCGHHMGAHAHIHVAEGFAKKINSL